MSLESVVKKSPWYSRLASKVLVPLTFGLASVFGCSYNGAGPNRVPIDRPEVQRESVAIGPTNPFAEVEPLDESLGASAFVTASFAFDIKDTEKGYASDIDDIVDKMRNIKVGSSDLFAESLAADSFDGVYDDRLRFDYHYYFDEQDLRAGFEFPSPVNKVDSELIYPQDEIFQYAVLNFSGSNLRDLFISYLSGKPIAFGRLIDLAADYCGDDKTFDSSEFNALQVQLDAAIKTGEMKAGRGSISASKNEDSGKVRVWNAYVSPIFRISGSSNEVSNSKTWLFESGSAFFPTVNYNSLIMPAIRADSYDGDIDGVISSAHIRTVKDANTDDSERDFESLSDSDKVRFKSWPVYQPTVKFSFYSELERNRFVKHIAQLPVPSALIANLGLRNAGVDGIFQKSEVDNLLYWAQRASLSARFSGENDGELYPSSVSSLPAAYITSVIDIGFDGDWERNAAIFFEMCRKLGDGQGTSFLRAFALDQGDGTIDDRIKQSALMSELDGQGFRDEVLASVRAEKTVPEGPFCETFKLDDVCLSWTQPVFFTSVEDRDWFITELSKLNVSSGEILAVMYATIGSDSMFDSAEAEEFFKRLPSQKHSARNERSRIETDSEYFKHRLENRTVDKIDAVLTVEYHLLKGDVSSKPLQTLRKYTDQEGMTEEQFIKLLRDMDIKDGKIDGDISENVVNLYVSGKSLYSIEAEQTKSGIRAIGRYDTFKVPYVLFFSSKSDLKDFTKVINQRRLSKAGVAYITQDVFGKPMARNIRKAIDYIKSKDISDPLWYVHDDPHGSFKYPE